MCWTPASDSLASLKNFSISSSVLFVLQDTSGLCFSSSNDKFIFSVHMGSSRSFLFADICTSLDAHDSRGRVTGKWHTASHLKISLTVRLGTFCECCLSYAWNTSYHFQEFFSQGFSIFFGSFSKSLIKLLDKLAVVSRQSLSTTIFLFNALTFKDIPLTLDSFDCTCCAALLNVTPSVKLDCSEGFKPASVATFQ